MTFSEFALVNASAVDPVVTSSPVITATDGRNVALDGTLQDLVCTENPVRVDGVMKLPKLAE